jgi:hypothetical protein
MSWTLPESMLFRTRGPSQSSGVLTPAQAGTSINVLTLAEEAQKQDKVTYPPQTFLTSGDPFSQSFLPPSSAPPVPSLSRPVQDGHLTTNATPKLQAGPAKRPATGSDHSSFHGTAPGLLPQFGFLFQNRLASFCSLTLQRLMHRQGPALPRLATRTRRHRHTPRAHKLRSGAPPVKLRLCHRPRNLRAPRFVVLIRAFL